MLNYGKASFITPWLRKFNLEIKKKKQPFENKTACLVHINKGVLNTCIDFSMLLSFLDESSC